MLRYIVSHWRGEQGLAWSFWVNGILLSVLTAYGFLLLEEPMFQLRIATVIGLQYLLALLQVALRVWQLVGIWRSATRTASRTGRRFWPVSAKTFVVLSIVLGVTSLLALTRDLQKASLALGDPDYADYSIERILDLELFLTGAINDQSVDEVIAALTEAGNPRLRIDSHGGLTQPAARLATYLRRNRVQVLADRNCWSACVWLLAASPEAAIHPWTQVTFHRAEPIAGFRSTAMRASLDRSLDHIHALDREFGIPGWVVEKVRREEFWTPTIRELLDIGIIALVYDPEAAALVPARDYCDRHPAACDGTVPN